jgi:hypothetical protein
MEAAAQHPPGAPGVLRRALDNRTLRRVELGFAGFNAAEYGEWVAVLVYAYGRGGTTVAAVVAAVQLVPSAFAAPVLASLADRYPPGQVLIAGYLGVAVTTGLTGAVMLAAAPALIVYAAAVVAAVPFTMIRPTQSALLPGIARTPDELTAANVVSNWCESAGIVAGPVVAGLIIDPVGPGGVLVTFAVAAVVCAAVVWPARDAAKPGSDAHEGESAGVVEGARALRESPHTGFLVGVVGSQMVAIGALDVLNVVLAFRILHTGRPGVAFLNAAFGAGGILGAALTVTLIGRRRLARPLLAGAAVWGAAFVVLGLQSTNAGALLLLSASGAARSLFDVSGRSLLQRVSDARVLARVFGLLEGLEMAALAGGSLLVPVLIWVGGPRTAVIGVGLVLPLAMLAGLTRLLTIDAHARVPIVEINLLRLSRLFSPLPAPALEALAHSLQAVSAPAGEVLIREGDPGDLYYTIAGGEVSITRAGRPVATMGRGEGFGEIALLRDVPRTATVTARTDVQLFTLAKPAFLASVTGHAPAQAVADAVVSERLPPASPVG